MLPEVNTLLYATSLGDHTRPVFRHAIKMAQAYNAKIVMVHALEPIRDFIKELISYHLSEEETREQKEQEIEEKVLKTMRDRVQAFYEEELNHINSHHKVSIDFVIERSNIIDLIFSTAKTHQVDMIILGNHTHAGLHSHITQGVIKDTKIPVLVIPNE